MNNLEIFIDISGPSMPEQKMNSAIRLRALNSQKIMDLEEDLTEIYVNTLAGQCVDSKRLLSAVKKYGGKYFLKDKSFYRKKRTPDSFSKRFKRKGRLK